MTLTVDELLNNYKFEHGGSPIGQLTQALTELRDDFNGVRKAYVSAIDKHNALLDEIDSFDQRMDELENIEICREAIKFFTATETTHLEAEW